MEKNVSILYNIFAIGQVTSREYSGPCENTMILYKKNREYVKFCPLRVAEEKYNHNCQDLKP